MKLIQRKVDWFEQDVRRSDHASIQWHEPPFSLLPPTESKIQDLTIGLDSKVRRAFALRGCLQIKIGTPTHEWERNPWFYMVP